MGLFFCRDQRNCALLTMVVWPVTRGLGQEKVSNGYSAPYMETFHIGTDGEFDKMSCHENRDQRPDICGNCGNLRNTGRYMYLHSAPFMKACNSHQPTQQRTKSLLTQTHFQGESMQADCRSTTVTPQCVSVIG